MPYQLHWLPVVVPAWLDAGVLEAGALDTGALDAGLLDLGVLDAGAEEAPPRVVAVKVLELCHSLSVVRYFTQNE